MIDITKTYKTKKGFAVKLYDIIDDRVMGAVNLVDTATNTWCAVTWNLFGITHNSNFDLVEVPKFSIDLLLTKKLLKDVLYCGKYVTVPFNTKWIYVTRNGILWASITKPVWYEITQDWCAGSFDPIATTEVGRGDYTGDIKDSLVKV